MLPNLGTKGSQLEEPLVPKCWNQCFPILEPRFPVRGGAGSQTFKPILPNLGTTGSWWPAKVVTNASQSWNHRFPVRGGASSQTFEPILPNLGTTGSWLEQLTMARKSCNQCFPILEPRVPSSRKCWFPNAWINASQPWNHGFPARGTAGFPSIRTNASQPWNHRFSVLGTSDSKSWNQSFPIMEPRVPSSNRWWSEKVVTNASQSWNHGFPARGTQVLSSRNKRFQKLKPILPNHGTTGSQLEQMMVRKSCNQCFPILEPRVPSSRNCWLPKHSNQCCPTVEPRVPSSRNEPFQKLKPILPNLGTTGSQLEQLMMVCKSCNHNASQSWNHGFPARGTAGSQSFEPMLPNLGTTGSQFEERAVPKRWNLYISFPILFPSVRTNASQSWNLCFPILEPRVPSSRNWRPKCWNQCSPSLELCVSSPRNCRLFPSLEPWIPSSRNRLLDLQELYTCFQGWKLCFAAWHVFNFQELRPACVCAKQGVYWTDMHIKKTRRRMAWECKGAEPSGVSMETHY